MKKLLLVLLISNLFLSCKEDEEVVKLGSEQNSKSQPKPVLDKLNCKSLFAEHGKCFVSQTQKIYNLPVDHSPVKGSNNALVTIVEFTDFQCPYCSKMAIKFNILENKYSGDLRVVFKNYPLSYHAEALFASKVGMVLKKEKGNGAFWKYHDIIFANGTKLDENFILKTAIQQGINPKLLKNKLDENLPDKLVKSDINLGKKVKVEGTPWIFVNGIKLENQGLEKLIEAQIEYAGNLVKAGTPRNKIYNYITNHKKTFFKRKLDKETVEKELAQFKSKFLENCKANSENMSQGNYYYILHQCAQKSNKCTDIKNCIKDTLTN
ncbi:MAG: thioredoxin domain-containing protein [Deltaproteobacteria bacterium]|jgi:protein-disulfide isomerase|nr:thioredoxin domain-containing protein [Deltaproteobacteria bacterium]